MGRSTCLVGYYSTRVLQQCVGLRDCPRIVSASSAINLIRLAFQNKLGTAIVVASPRFPVSTASPITMFLPDGTMPHRLRSGDPH